MKKLSSFVKYKNIDESLISEHRGKSKKQLEQEKEEALKLAQDATKGKNVDKLADQFNKEAENFDKLRGKPVDKNSFVRQRFSLEEPTDDDAMTPLDPETFNKNKSRLWMKIGTGDDFFVQGKAGWGKTSIIKDMAKKEGYRIITVYLDKCDAVDLAGIPVPVQDKELGNYQDILPPPYAAYMAEHKDQDFLLFFDEMNQAQPDVMNALMPIVLTHTICGMQFENFFVGAAGNLESENGSLNELSEPLKQRFAPLIIWETDTDEAWQDAIDYMHKKWDKEIDKRYIDLIDQCHNLFASPRLIEHKIISKYVIPCIKKNRNFKVDMWYDHLDRLSLEEKPRSAEKQLKLLAEKTHELVANGGKLKDDEEKSRRKNREMFDEEFVTDMIDACENGFIPQNEGGKIVKYGVSRENFIQLGGENYNAEMMQRLLDILDGKDVKFAFETDEEYKKAGYKDPLED